MMDPRVTMAGLLLSADVPPMKPTRSTKGWRTSEPPVDPIRNESNRVGRNDPCPCESGKKFKKCCLYEKDGAE